jgi:hypothetical protein
VRLVTVIAAWGSPTDEVAEAVKMARVASVAVKTQVPVEANSTVEKVATPATVVTETGAARHVELMVIKSVDPVPMVSTLLLASSTATLNAVMTVPVVVTEVGGATVKATLAGAPPLTATSVLVVGETVPEFVESVAVR